MRRPDVGVVLDTLEHAGELIHAHGQEGTATYWRPIMITRNDGDPSDPDAWMAPIPLRSARFRRTLSDLFPAVPPIKSKCKDYVEAAEAAAFSGRRVSSVGWSDKQGRGPSTVIRIAISPAVVVAVSADSVLPEPNGMHGLYEMPEEFTPLAWGDMMSAAREIRNPCGFQHALAAVVGDLPPPDPLSAMTADEQAALVLAWWAGIVVEPICRGRPMLTMLGEPGSGKTLTAKLMGVLYYGEDFDVGGGAGGSRAVKDLVASMVHSPVAVADDLTNVKRDIVDVLCRLATGSSVKLATMHETLKQSTFKSRAATILTSARPGWALRDDLLSRLLPIMLGSTGPSPLTSQDRIDRAVEHRAGAWAELILATQIALRDTPRPQFRTRFEDWELMVRRMALTGGWHHILDNALGKLKHQTVRMATKASLEVSALYHIAKQFEAEPRDWTIAELYDLVMDKMGAMLTEDPRLRPSGRMRIQEFSKFLDRVQTEGSTVVDLYSRGERGGQQVWTIRPKV